MKLEDSKQLIFLGVGAMLALLSTFIFDFYKTFSSEQRILWNRDFDTIEINEVCENNSDGATRLLLHNTSNNTANVRLVLEGKISTVATEPKHITQFDSSNSELSEITITDLVSKENVRVLVCGVGYKSPTIEAVIASGKSQDSASLLLELNEHSFNDKFSIVKYMAKWMGLWLLAVFIYSLGQINGAKQSRKSGKKDMESKET